MELVTRVKTTHYDKNGNPLPPVYEDYIPREQTLRVSRTAPEVAKEVSELRIQSKSRVHIYY